MSEKKNMTGKENSFHMENFRRRSRYAAVFLVLENPPSAYSDGGNPGRCSVPVGLPFTDFF